MSDPRAELLREMDDAWTQDEPKTFVEGALTVALRLHGENEELRAALAASVPLADVLAAIEAVTQEWSGSFEAEHALDAARDAIKALT